MTNSVRGELATRAPAGAGRGGGQVSEEPILLLVEMVFNPEGEEAISGLSDRLTAELRSLPGLLECQLYWGEDQRYLFYTVWQDRESVQAWVENQFHRETLMKNFRDWATESTFNYWQLAETNPRARKCPKCGRWNREEPGWRVSQGGPCSKCGAAL